MAGIRGKQPPQDAETTRAIRTLLTALRAERIRREMTIGQVSSQLETADSRLSALERGIGNRGQPANVTLAFVVRWARLFGWDIGLVVNPTRTTMAAARKVGVQPRRKAKLGKKTELAIQAAEGKATAKELAKKYRVSQQVVIAAWKRKPIEEV
jgi:hypothetical protein